MKKKRCVDPAVQNRSPSARIPRFAAGVLVNEARL